jgi:hypothetical protein
MTIQEIETILKCDITGSKRDMHLVYLRSLVSNELRLNQGLTLYRIAKMMNRTHASIVNVFNKLDYYKKDPLFKYIENAYINADINELKKFFTEQKVRRMQYNKLHHEKTYKRKPRVAKEKVKEITFKRPHVLEVAEKLRKINTHLNNKQYNKWEYEDFLEYQKKIS